MRLFYTIFIVKFNTSDVLSHYVTSNGQAERFQSPLLEIARCLTTLDKRRLRFHSKAHNGVIRKGKRRRCFGNHGSFKGRLVHKLVHLSSRFTVLLLIASVRVKFIDFSHLSYITVQMGTL